MGSTGQVSAAVRPILGKNRTTKGGLTGSIFGLTPHNEPRRTWPSWDCLQKKTVTASEIVAIILNYLTREESVCTFFANIGRNFPS